MHKTQRISAAIGHAILASAASLAAAQSVPPVKIAPAAMPRVGSVDERFQSYNIEMVEVTGGRFWKPYASTAKEKTDGGNQPVGMNPGLYEYRPPIDLSNPRLRKLAAALGPAYLRVSGTWANSTYFDPTAEAAPQTAPQGFKGVLTGKEWKGVIDFAHAANDEIVTSFATSAGTRDAAGVWTPAEGEKLLAFTHAAGGQIAAAEFMNEPTFAEIGGAPKGYDAAAFARDIAVFLPFARQNTPKTLILGPGGVGEGALPLAAGMHTLPTPDLMAATGPVFDAFSYHSYGGVSSRCGGKQSVATALDADWLDSGGKIEAYYAGIRDRFEPGKAIWDTETAEAACGGDRWASTFIDSFRYLNQLGDLAKRGVQVQLHNTLAASDYGLLDEKTYSPRPNYWAALLWRRLMGTTVLDAGPAPSGLRLYAHCLRNHPGGVAMLAINLSTKVASLEASTASERYSLTAKELTAPEVELNGQPLSLEPGDTLPVLKGLSAKAGKIELAPQSIAFLAFPKAENANCQK